MTLHTFAERENVTLRRQINGWRIYAAIGWFAFLAVTMIAIARGPSVLPEGGGEAMR